MNEITHTVEIWLFFSKFFHEHSEISNISQGFWSSRSNHEIPLQLQFVRIQMNIY